ncbi:MAG: E2 ligase fold family C protein [Bryobacterales bacterium]|nr:E2 ligase fold family C protein [Bryobacterales bacterium]
MAVPDYFQRNAVAISQAISGLDEQRLEARLGDVCVGVTIGPDADGEEGRAMADLLVRMLARLYPSLVIGDEGEVGVGDQVSALAHRINPRIDLSGQPTVEVVAGTARPRSKTARTVFAGSKGWSAKLSTHGPQGCGTTNNPFGAGLAACLAAADVFRHVFLPGAELDGGCEIAVPNVGEWATGKGDLQGSVGSLVLAGAGAIGNAAAWALSRAQVDGSIEIIDHESVDLGNLQRYVLAERGDEKRPKAPFVAGRFNGGLSASAHECTLAEFLVKKNHRVDNLLLALDSAKDRCAAQASLPRRIANAWTQPGDLGVSSHDFLEGACVNCLYLPHGEQKNEDQIIAESFGLPDQLREVRNLLYKNEGAPRDLLEAIATAQGLPIEKLLPFQGRPLRALYSEGFCGGAVIPLSNIGRPANDVHVPLAHQSALAGVLLAAAGVRMGLSRHVNSFVAQYDVLKPQERFQANRAAKHARERCICQDADYREVYRSKYR